MKYQRNIRTPRSKTRGKNSSAATPKSLAPVATLKLESSRPFMITTPGTKGGAMRRPIPKAAAPMTDYSPAAVVVGTVVEPTPDTRAALLEGVKGPTLGPDRVPVIPEISPGKNVDAHISGPLSVSGYSDQISGNWRRGVESFLKIGRLCAEADALLPPEDKKSLLSLLPFGASAFSKFVGIGKDRRLQTPKMQSMLPPAYTTIYEVSQLDDAELQCALDESILTPDLTREAIKKWRRGTKDKLSEERSGAVIRVSPPEEEDSRWDLFGRDRNSNAGGHQADIGAESTKIAEAPGMETGSPPGAPSSAEAHLARNEPTPSRSSGETRLRDLSIAWQKTGRLARQAFVIRFRGEIVEVIANIKKGP